MPALLRAEKLIKKARKARLIPAPAGRRSGPPKARLGGLLFDLVTYAQGKGWVAEHLLRAEIRKRERSFRRAERRVTVASVG